VSAGDDAAMMRRAIAAARARLGQTWPNPVVGCVIAKDGVVLAEAVTANGGRPHAEEQALALIGEAARGATAYVTLEPCGERSSGAPSCSERLALAGVERVVIAADNPEPLSAGRGLARLHEAGAPVEVGFLAEEAEPLYRAFRHKLKTGLPLVEAAANGAGFDARFEPRGQEPLAETLRRYGQTGYTRLWVEHGSDLASSLADLRLLGPVS
jgi:diaminohydroxyphosphoribosylaminopyrimidine deaminase/5-amino-6-(5-phosphoribosylamino)uracil reductase